MLKHSPWNLPDGIDVLIRRGEEDREISVSLSTRTKERSHEDIMRRQPSANLEEGPHHTSNLPALTAILRLFVTT